MARKIGVLELTAFFFAAVIVLTACRATAGFMYGPPFSTVFDALFYIAILGFLASIVYGVFRLYIKMSKK